MKKNSTLLILLCFLPLFLTAQTGFEKKKRTTSGKVPDPSEKFIEIDAGKSQKGRVAAGVSRIDINLLKTSVYRDPEDGTVVFVRNEQKKTAVRNARVSFTETGKDFLKSVKKQLRVADPDTEFELLDEQTDELGYHHLRYRQVFRGVPLYGGEALLHTKEAGLVEFMNGKVFPTPALSVVPALNKEEALAKASDDLGRVTILQQKGLAGRFLGMEADQAELVIMTHDGQQKLVYHMTVRPNLLERWVYFVDAVSGEILDKYNHTCTLDGVYKTSAKDLNGITQSFNIVQSGQTYYMIDPSKPMYNAQRSKLPDSPVGVIWTIDAQNSRIDQEEMKLSHVVSGNGTTWNATAVSAHTNAGICYEYYRSKFSRKSLNGSDGSIISVINIADEDGRGLDNAYWNGQFMGYGNGRDGFKPLAGALDVAGHEMTHGVIENTAKLEYRNQSGALNESFADIFGVLIDNDDWTIGEDVVKKNVFPSGALRSLQNPNQGGKSDPGYQPKNMSQYAFLRDIPSEDNGGVHVNSGIPNHAFYLFTTSSGMNREKAEKVYYRVLTTYLTRTSKFTDLRLAVIQASKDLYGEGSEAAAARAAFDAVGITDPSGGSTSNPTTPTPPTNDILENPGTESLVVHDPTDGSMYAGAFTGNAEFKVIASKYGCLGKPSVTDDGSFVYFVGSDKHIYRVNLIQRTAPQKLSSDASWRNVAISKNGTLLAALTYNADNYIYVFNLQTNKNARFKLYNPTYSSGVNTGEVQYADSFQWDYSGENLIYDAFNEVRSLFGSIEYWDVGVLKAWDAGAGDFGSGVIDKIFTDLAEGENIGNPALAKTNSSILAFDYFDAYDEGFHILTVNLETGDIADVQANNDIGYPDYSKTDKIIVFNSLNGKQSVVKGVGIKADKISPDGNRPITYFTDAKWAVWYAQGARTLPAKTSQTVNFTVIPDQRNGVSFDLSATASSNLPVQFLLVSGDAVLSGKRITLGNIPGKVTVKAFQIGDSRFTAASAEQTFCIVPAAPVVSESGEYVVASGGSLYQWYVNNNPVGGQTTNNRFRKDFAGAYSVRAITQDGCMSPYSNSIGIAPLANEPLTNEMINVFPNPVKDFLRVELKNGGETLEKLSIADNTGRTLLESSTSVINLQTLPSGTYLLRVKTGKGEYARKVIRE